MVPTFGCYLRARKQLRALLRAISEDPLRGEWTAPIKVLMHRSPECEQ
jgi:hypothetical protein